MLDTLNAIYAIQDMLTQNSESVDAETVWNAWMDFMSDVNASMKLDNFEEAKTMLRAVSPNVESIPGGSSGGDDEDDEFNMREETASKDEFSDGGDGDTGDDDDFGDDIDSLLDGPDDSGGDDDFGDEFAGEDDDIAGSENDVFGAGFDALLGSGSRVEGTLTEAGDTLIHSAMRLL